MNKYFGIFLFCIASMFLFSCSSDDDKPDVPEQKAEKTIVVFFPYTGNLYGYLSNNIADMESAMLNTADNPNVLVYMNKSKNSSCLYSIRREGDVCIHDTLRVYEGKDNTSADQLASLFSEIKSLTPNTTSYNMIIGCHGMGWIFGDDFSHIRSMYPPKYFGDESNPNPITRWMGGSSSKIDVSIFAEALQKASFHSDLMLFDVCYMANVESLYELRDVSDYIIASPIEIMGSGMPYRLIWNEIIESTPQSMNSLCNKVYNFYKTGSQPYCALSVIDCSKLENLAYAVKDINANCQFDESQRESLQMLDGYRPSLFYDMGRYVELQCSDAALSARYTQAFNEVVLYHYHTDKFYTALTQGAYGENSISYSSGVTTSAPSVNKLSEAGWHRTSWYKATH